MCNSFHVFTIYRFSCEMSRINDFGAIVQRNIQLSDTTTAAKPVAIANIRYFTEQVFTVLIYNSQI